MSTIQLINPNDKRYFYQVEGKRVIKPYCRIVKDKPFLPTDDKEEKYDVLWSFGSFGGKATLDVNHETTLSDILEAIKPQAWIFNDQTIVSYVAVYTDAHYISVRLSEVVATV